MTERTSYTKWAAIFTAIAEDKEIQFRSIPGGKWIDIPHRNALLTILETDYQPEEFRAKPDVVMIGSFEVPGPIRGPIVKGTKIHMPSIGATQGLVMYFEYDPRNTAHESWRKRGLLHFDARSANIHAKALLQFTDTHEEVNE